MSIGTRILTLVAVMAFFAAGTAASYHALVFRVRDMATQRTTELMLQDYRNELKDLVDAMASALASATDAQADERETHRVFTRLVKSARFFTDSSGYYFIYKAGGTVFVLPTLHPEHVQGALGGPVASVYEKRGTWYANFKDATGRHLRPGVPGRGRFHALTGGRPAEGPAPRAGGDVPPAS
jgi:signal transduction histidine kinase